MEQDDETKQLNRQLFEAKKILSEKATVQSLRNYFIATKYVLKRNLLKC